MKPWRGRKKNCTPLLACSSVSVCGSVGLSAGEPTAVPVKVRVATSAWTWEATTAPELARSGILKYSYAGTVSSSRYSPAVPMSRSYAVIDASASRGSTIV